MRRLPHLVLLSFSISGTILFIRVHFITINLKLLASRWFEKFHIRTPEKTGILTSLCGKVCLLVSDWWLVKGCLLTRYSTIFSISTFIFSLYLEIECCDQFHSYVESITSIGRPWDECSLRTTPALHHPRYPQTYSFSTHKKWNICADRPCDILPKGEKMLHGKTKPDSFRRTEIKCAAGRPCDDLGISFASTLCRRRLFSFFYDRNKLLPMQMEQCFRKQEKRRKEERSGQEP